MKNRLQCASMILVGALLPILVGCDSDTSQAQTAPHRVAHAKATARPKPTPDACKVAEDLHHAAVGALNSSEYRSSYQAADRGLAVVSTCPDDDTRLVLRAFLLSSRGLAAHFITEGDSRTDLNQANQLLVECETRPSLYGTQIAAQCETEEQNNIASQTNWDVYGN